MKNFDGSTINDIGYAHGLTGCAVILSEISRLFPNKKFNSIIEELIDKENQIIENIGIDYPECKELGEKLKKYEYEMSEEKSIQKMLSMETFVFVTAFMETLKY